MRPHHGHKEETIMMANSLRQLGQSLAKDSRARSQEVEDLVQSKVLSVEGLLNDSVERLDRQRQSDRASWESRAEKLHSDLSTTALVLNADISMLAAKCDQFLGSRGDTSKLPLELASLDGKLLQSPTDVGSLDGTFIPV